MIGPEFLQGLKAYLGFSQADGRAIRAVAKHLSSHVPDIAEAFYDRLAKDAEARAVVGGPEQVERLKRTLQIWLAQFLAGPWDEAYMDLRARIGRVHVRVGLPQRFMILSMEGIRSDIMRAMEQDVLDPAAREAAAKAIGKLCSLDLAIMLEAYQHDFLERLQRAERAERQLLSERLGDVERRNREIIGGIGALVVGLDSQRRILFMNETAEAVCGTILGEVAGNDWVEEFSPPDWRDRARAALDAHLGGKIPDSPLRPLLTRDGQVRWIEWLPTTVRRGQLPTLYAVGVDVTERRELERRAQQSERLATAGTLAAGLAHEIRNPLNAAALQLTLLERKLSQVGPEQAASALGVAETIRGELTRLQGLVTEFLEFARPRALNLERADVTSLLTEVVQLIKPDAMAAGARLGLSEAGVLPQVTMDVERVRQVLLNLLRNAIEAVTAGGGEGNVVVRAQAVTGSVEIQVEDDGPGIPDASAPIFDAFYTTKESGTGLGLAIVHRLVSEHGGSVHFESRPGKTVFTVSLPA